MPYFYLQDLTKNIATQKLLLYISASFDALKSGFYHLESQDTRSYSGPASLVRSNLGTILESLDILAGKCSLTLISCCFA